MANLASQMLDHRASVFLQTDHFAETISWTDPGEAARDIVAVVAQEQTRIEYDDQEKSFVYEAELHVSVSDVAAVVPHASRATFHDLTWTAYADEPLQHGMRKIRVRARKTVSFQANDYESRG